MELRDGAKIALELSRTGLRYKLEQVARVGAQGVKAMAVAIVTESELALWIAVEKIAQTRIAEIGIRDTAPGAKR